MPIKLFDVGFLTGNPIGGLVFSNAFGELQQIHEWTVSIIYYPTVTFTVLGCGTQIDSL